MIAGVICATVSLVFSPSYATLIFSGPLVPWPGYGITATFMTAAIGGVVMALRSSLPFALASPDASTTAIMAALVSTQSLGCGECRRSIACAYIDYAIISIW